MSYWRYGCAAACTLVSLAAPMVVRAQVATSVVPDAGGNSLGTSVTTDGGGEYEIDGGTVSGGNLFHSFSDFDLGSGDTARWVYNGGDAGSIRNVINRVTGGMPSYIDGRIDTYDLPQASFYFINPAGIVLGAGAVLDVPGAMHFSTASRLDFSDGASFSVATPSGSTLSMAAPEAFGFVGGEGDIAVEGIGGWWDVAPLSLVARDIRIEDSSINAAAVSLTAVGPSAADVAVAPGESIEHGFAGRLSISGSDLRTDATAGVLYLNGGQVDIVDDSTLETGDAAPDLGPAIEIRASESIALEDSTVRSRGVGGDIYLTSPKIGLVGGTIASGGYSGDLASGGIILQASEIGMAGNSDISVEGGATDLAHSIEIRSDKLSISEGSRVRLFSNFEKIGDLYIACGKIALDQGYISSETAYGAFNAVSGDMNIHASQLIMKNNSDVHESSEGGKSGLIYVDVSNVSLAGSRIRAESDDYSESGSIYVKSDVISLNDNSEISITGDLNIESRRLNINSNSRLSVSGSSIGKYGKIYINADDISMLDGNILVSSSSKSKSGSLYIKANNFSMRENSTISADNFSGPALGSGNIDIDSNNTVIESGSRINARSLSSGNGGNININSGEIKLDGAGISSNLESGLFDPEAGEGNAGGNITIRSNNIEIKNRTNISSSTSTGGHGGTIKIMASGAVKLSGGSRLLSESQFSFNDQDQFGDAGDIVVEGRDISVSNSNISTNTGSKGNAGSISLTTGGTLLIDQHSLISSNSVGIPKDDTPGQFGDAGDVHVKAEKLIVQNNSAIAAATRSTGAGGTVDIEASRVQLLDGGVIATDTQGAGDAGDVMLETGDLEIRSSTASPSGIRSASFPEIVEGGDAGKVSVVADRVAIGKGGFLSTATWTEGHGGTISLVGGEILISDGGFISSGAHADGDAGNVDIKAAKLRIENLSGIGSIAYGYGDGTGQGNAGNISIDVTDLEMVNGGGINTNTRSAGNAGSITAHAGRSLALNLSYISSNAEAGASGRSGSVRLETESLSMIDRAVVATNAHNGERAGDISVGATDILLDNAVIASGNFGQAGGAAGDVVVSVGQMRLSNGAQLSTDATTGTAGAISLAFAPGGLLTMDSGGTPSAITTTSGTKSGGRIDISGGGAVIMNGAVIQALGPGNAALIDTHGMPIVQSGDRRNEVAVAGILTPDSQIVDINRSLIAVADGFVDASRVLSGRCSGRRAEGLTSRLDVPFAGPYGAWPGCGGGTGGVIAASGADTVAPAGPASPGGNAAIRGIEVIGLPGAGQALVAKTGYEVVSRDGLRLVVTAGQTLDGTWIAEQFELNGMTAGETSPARVLGLILALNRVYQANGYVNSGLRLDRQARPGPGQPLVLSFVSGKIVAANEGQPAVAVEWAASDRPAAHQDEARPGPKTCSASTEMSAGGERRVTEGGAQGLTARYVRARLPSAGLAPFDDMALERDFRRLADDPAIRTVNARVVPGEVAGTAQLIVCVDPQPRFDGYAIVSNSRSPSIGGERLALGGSVRNLVAPGSVTSIEIGTTSGASDFAATYWAPLTASIALKLRYSKDDAGIVDEAVRALDIRSRDTEREVGMVFTRLNRPLMPVNPAKGTWQPAQSLQFGISLARRHSVTTLLGMPFSFSPGAEDGVTDYSVLRLSSDWMSRGPRQVLAVSQSVNFGLGGTAAQATGIARPNPHFVTGLTQAAYARNLNGGSLVLRAHGALQLSSAMLYSGERFGVGGAGTVRGYRQNLILADSGIAASVELGCSLRWRTKLCGRPVRDWKTVQAAVFYDAAHVWNHGDPQPVTGDIHSLGLNLKWEPGRRTMASLTFAHPLARVAQQGRPDIQDRGFSFVLSWHPLG